MKPEIENIRQLTQNKHLNMFLLECKDSKGIPMDYYVAARHSTVEGYEKSLASGKIDAVCVFATDSEDPDMTVLVRQWRYPVGDYVYELPSGLIDRGETPGLAAQREFHEETGMEVKLTGRSFGAYYPSCGMTNERIMVYYGIASGAVSKDFQTEHEDIETCFVHYTDVPDILKKEKVGMVCGLVLESWYQQRCEAHKAEYGVTE